MPLPTAPTESASSACWLALPAAVLLASCGPGQNDPGPGGVTVGEARALDEAAQMLDEQRLPPAAASDASSATAPEG